VRSCWSPAKSVAAGIAWTRRSGSRVLRGLVCWVRHDGVMGSRALSPLWLRAPRPSSIRGALVSFVCLVVATLAIYPLSRVAPVVSLSVVYLPAVVVASAFWGLWLGLATAIGSAAAFNFFHLPPVGQFTIADSRNWVALGAFAVVAVATGLIGELARGRAEEADQRRREADLAAELAQLLLGGARVDLALALAAQRLAVAIRVGAAAIELQDVEPNDRQITFPLRESGQPIGTLVLPATLTPADQARVADRIVPPLESILGATLHRAQLQAEVVETAALRRSDEMKTAVLRSVSHDLRTTVTAILTAIAVLDPEQPTADSVLEVREVVTYAATRLARLIEKLLDLTAVESGTLAPRCEWYSIEEVLSEAIEGIESAADVFQLSLDPGIPLLKGDPGQLERAFGNLLENAARYSNSKPVSVRARSIGPRVRVRIVDQGPGIRPREQERIFLPFYRSTARRTPGRSTRDRGWGSRSRKGSSKPAADRLASSRFPARGRASSSTSPLTQPRSVEGPPDVREEDLSSGPIGAAVSQRVSSGSD
jgi:two-component system, OmpR family, sensor histidine kinase KdpD